MNRIGSLACTAVLGAVILVSCGRAEEPFFDGGFKAACEKASKTKQLVLIDFYTTWCLPCKKLDQTTWNDKDVRAWLKDHCVSLKIDAEKEEALAKRFQITSFPTIVLLKPDGTEIDRLVGYKGPADFLAEAKDALAGKDGITRVKEKLVGKNKDNPTLRMALGDALARRGRHEEALKEYVWCLEQGSRHDPTFATPPLFMQISFLAAAYEPARKLLKDRKDAWREAIVKGKASEDDIENFGMLCRYERKSEEILKLFDELRAKKSPQANKLFDHAVDLLVEKRRYQDVVEVGGDFAARVREGIDEVNKFVQDKKLDPAVVQFLKDDLVKEAGRYYEALLGTDRLRPAEALRDQLLAFDGRVNTYATLVRHARLAEKPQVVEALLASAKRALSAEEYKQVEGAK
jgi:thioredoxin-related protein